MATAQAAKRDEMVNSLKTRTTLTILPSSLDPENKIAARTRDKLLEDPNVGERVLQFLSDWNTPKQLPPTYEITLTDFRGCPDWTAHTAPQALHEHTWRVSIKVRRGTELLYEQTSPVHLFLLGYDDGVEVDVEVQMQAAYARGDPTVGFGSALLKSVWRGMGKGMMETLQPVQENPVDRFQQRWNKYMPNRGLTLGWVTYWQEGPLHQLLVKVPTSHSHEELIEILHETLALPPGYHHAKEAKRRVYLAALNNPAIWLRLEASTGPKHAVQRIVQRAKNTLQIPGVTPLKPDTVHPARNYGEQLAAAIDKHAGFFNVSITVISIYRPDPIYTSKHKEFPSYSIIKGGVPRIRTLPGQSYVPTQNSKNGRRHADKGDGHGSPSTTNGSIVELVITSRKVNIEPFRISGDDNVFPTRETAVEGIIEAAMELGVLQYIHIVSRIYDSYLCDEW